MRPDMLANPPTRPQMGTWHLDWFAATVKVPVGDRQAATADYMRGWLRRLAGKLPPGEEPWERTTPRHGYQVAVRLTRTPGCVLQWQGTDDQGIHVSLSGTALAALRWVLRKVELDWPEWSALLGLMDGTKRPWQAARIDVAHDSATFAPGTILMQQAYGGLVTRLGRVQEHSERGRGLGTITMGSRESGAFVRVYDKADEQSKGDRITRSALAPWYRFEIEYKGDRADRLVDTWRRDGRRGVMGEVDKVVSFRERTADSNVTRRPLQPWWLEALGGQPVKPVVAPKSQADQALDARLAWATQHVGRLLAELASERGIEAAHVWTEETITQARCMAELERQRRAV